MTWPYLRLINTVEELTRCKHSSFLAVAFSDEQKKLIALSFGVNIMKKVSSSLMKRPIKLEHL